MTGNVTPGPDQAAGNDRLTCRITGGDHYVITQSDGSRVCQICGAVLREAR